mmetsp:Transcript_108918/g.306945  ORF Transcript_108918/g.306945 Transcript_108918/m.306945 type:complete len:273 (-) Transcript_108918:96-914(-)
MQRPFQHCLVALEGYVGDLYIIVQLQLALQYGIGSQTIQMLRGTVSFKGDPGVQAQTNALPSPHRQHRRVEHLGRQVAPGNRRRGPTHHVVQGRRTRQRSIGERQRTSQPALQTHDRPAAILPTPKDTLDNSAIVEEVADAHRIQELQLQHNGAIWQGHAGEAAITAHGARRDGETRHLPSAHRGRRDIDRPRHLASTERESKHVVIASVLGECESRAVGDARRHTADNHVVARLWPLRKNRGVADGHLPHALWQRRDWNLDVVGIAVRKTL